MSTRVAVLGTGRMGSAIARRLADSGQDLVLWNRTRSRAESVGAGIVVATPADAVAKADIVITSLTGPEALRATFAGKAGALTTAFGQTFVDMSTAGPDVLQELAPLVARTGSTLLDAPLIGPPPAVLSGAALVIAGGSSDAVQRVRPILERLGELRHVGPFGSGARMKLVANSMLGALIFVAAELETAATSAGLDPGTTFDILTRFVPSLAVRRAGYLQDKHEPTMFAVRDLQKDLHLALSLFHGVDAHVPLTALVREWLDEAASEGADLDISAVIRRYSKPDLGAARPASTGPIGSASQRHSEAASSQT